MEWRHGEDGPTCTCGWPTNVVVSGDQADLMCFGHTKEAGAMFPLPRRRPDNWPDLSHEEMERLVNEAFREREEG